MVRSTRGAGAPLQTRSLCLGGVLVAAVLGAGCQPLEFGVQDPAGETTTPATPVTVEEPREAPQAPVAQEGPAAKVDPRLLADPESDQPREVIALLDESRLATVVPHKSGALDDPLGIEAVARGFDLAKDQLMQRLAGKPVLATQRYRNLPAMKVRVDSAEALLALAADPAVARVARNEAHSLLQVVRPGLTLINQPAAAAAGKLGAGVSVAVLDTGTDYKRAPFSCAAAGATGCPVVYAADFAPEDNNVDDNGHGTNVSGIVLSVAPSAKIVALDVFRGASGWTTDIMAAIDWCIQNRSKYNIVAINMSLGGGSYGSACAQDPLAVSVASAKAAGILSAVASGNAGVANAISSPACAPEAVSVGAVYASTLSGLNWGSCSDPAPRADGVACFSNSSSLLTMLAPGVNIDAAGIVMSGTSQATPHVAGAMAVLRAAFPGETPAAIVTRLTSFGVPVKDARNGFTKPRLDLMASLNGTAPSPGTSPTPPPAPAAGPTGTIVLNNNAAYTKSTTVTATLATTSGTPTQVCLSESTTCTKWVAKAASVPFVLSTANGGKTVRAWWKNAAGAVSAEPAMASITLDTAAPTDGTLTGTATGLAVTFNWSGFSDAGAGLAVYRLLTGTTAVAAGCATGTVAYEGTSTTYTKTFSAAGTIYARVCAKDAIGNMSAGRIVTMVLTYPPRAAALTGADATTQVGNPAGGVAFDDACPAGQALIGFGGSLTVATTAARHRQISGRCGTLQVAGTVVTVKPADSLPTRGSAGTAAWTRLCPANQVVVGFAGRAGLLVDQITFSCAPLAAASTSAGAAIKVLAAKAVTAVGGTGGTAFPAVNCPVGKVATTARVRVGDNLDAFGLACASAAAGN